ncbi:MAG TPA: hypothetical protein VFQ63_00970 [Patescibacteria group bacterium]|nr:hypothetical protein [Patescibacteria group bacterium]
MICPKCEEGELQKIQFKKGKKGAYLCSVCDTFWFDDELIASSTGHDFELYSQEEEQPYSLDEVGEEDIEQDDGQKRSMYEQF